MVQGFGVWRLRVWKVRCCFCIVQGPEGRVHGSKVAHLGFRVLNAG